jgi:hypothetical protein
MTRRRPGSLANKGEKSALAFRKKRVHVANAET